MLTPDAIAANLHAIETRIGAACSRAGRERSSVRLVAVSKTFPAEACSAAIAAGAIELGENRVQETKEKQPHVHGRAKWHLIGHLQSNKAKDAVKLFDVMQTIDSVALAERVARFAEADGKRPEVFLEVNIGREPQKAGVLPENVEALARSVAAMPSLSLQGLMAIPPIGEDPETGRPYFRELRALAQAFGLPHLSMGMTDDFEVAIEEGATIVRVGRAIFGSRG